MNITLITPTPPDINAFGARMISSVLKKEGFDTRVIFLPGGIEHLRFDGSFIYKYPEKTLKQIAELCKDADIIGFSFMSLYYDRAAQITEYLKKQFSTPVIWGGIHPTYRPEQSLENCDIICIGEGENSVIDLARKMSRGEDYTDVKSCWFKRGGGVRKNEEGPIVHNLDALPFVDYDLKNHYVYNWRSTDIVHIGEAVMKEQFLRLPYFKDKHLLSYRTMTSRGCPHRCSYCASSAMMKLRRRSVDNVVEELEQMLKRFDYIEIISFFDDTFFAAPIEYFEEFRDKYKKRINLPFHAQCSPTTISERKMALLTDAGLYYTEMGIQTGSDRVKRMYKRVESNQKIIGAAALLHRYGPRMLMPDYHVILDNPWETREDVTETLKLLLALPGKFNLQISSLVFFPGTELNERAKKEGLLKDEMNEVCRKPFTFPKGTYLNYLIYLSGFPLIPRGLLRFASRGVFVNLLHTKEPLSFYNLLFAVSKKIRLAVKGVMALAKGDFGRIANYFRLAR
ncbi:MAG: B12-binding domain-containing radical SAM protein [Deltaproteobacteria bacterium]|nr:B12-binding domain-containing radical SAM protein [Deltaproteobacteria bacterium]